MGQVTEEPGTDLSVATEEACVNCGVMVPVENMTLHFGWHSRTEMNPNIGYNLTGDANSAGVYAGMPLDQAINNLAQAIAVIQRTIGTEGNFRFLRDWSKP